MRRWAKRKEEGGGDEPWQSKRGDGGLAPTPRVLRYVRKVGRGVRNDSPDKGLFRQIPMSGGGRGRRTARKTGGGFSRLPVQQLNQQSNKVSELASKKNLLVVLGGGPRRWPRQ